MMLLQCVKQIRSFVRKMRLSGLNCDVINGNNKMFDPWPWFILLSYQGISRYGARNLEMTNRFSL